ncbi:MAG: DUF3576 domain-containing protein [Boseongicola sp.]|nr:DUF3576 domain-containing protein [Boseongicola sp.]
MRPSRFALVLTIVAVTLSGCGRDQSGTGGEPSGSATEEERRETIWDLFTNVDDPNTTLEVNKYIWTASLDILNFLPIESADPFSGVITTGYGTPPGGDRAYRATVVVRDPALDARSLKVALLTRSGPAPAEAVRTVENAILTRARQLRVQDRGL